MSKIVLPNELMLEEVGTLLEEGREVSFTPLGSSMLPFIRGGKDTVTLKKKADVEVGDIVLARLEKSYVMHRVVDTNRNRLLLMGDGNIRGTEMCTRDDVIGTVVAIGGHKPSRGYVWRWLKPFRRILLAIIRRIQ